MCVHTESSYRVTVVCPRCGSNVSHVNGTAYREGLLSIAIAKCVGCGQEVEVCVRLRVLPRSEVDRKREARQRVTV